MRQLQEKYLSPSIAERTLPQNVSPLVMEGFILISRVEFLEAASAFCIAGSLRNYLWRDV
jgi:hypothetical protein